VDGMPLVRGMVSDLSSVVTVLVAGHPNKQVKGLAIFILSISSLDILGSHRAK
jgi:hypothetical protein